MQRTVITLTYLVDAYLLLFAIFILTQRSISVEMFGALTAVHLCVAFVFLLLLIWYIRDVVRNRELSSGARAGWILGFLFAALFAFPAYFHRFHRASPN